MGKGGDAHRLGRAGEELAAEYFADAGCVIVARNWRCASGEIDLVVHDLSGQRHHLVFCEVKSRATDRWGSPAEAVTPEKQQRLRRLAQKFLATHRACLDDALWVRFDVVEVLWPEGSASPVLRHLEDAF